MSTRCQSRILADPAPLPGAGGRGRLPGSEGMMTRARHRCLGVAYLPVPCAGSDPPRKQPRRDLAHRQPHSGHSEASQWRDWANLTTELIDDIAGRLLSIHPAEYIRFRAVCSPWRVSTDDPRTHGVLDSRFRPRGWSLLLSCEPTLPISICQHSTKWKAAIDQQEFSSHHFFGCANGLIIMCDKATNVVRLFNPLTGQRVDFPAITNVRVHDAAEPNACFLDMDAFKGSFSNPGVISSLAGIDDSTCPPTLLLSVRNESWEWHIICAKPGDEHWSPLNLRGMSVMAQTMVNYFNIGRPRYLGY